MLQHPTNVASMGIQHIQPPGDSDAEDPEEAFPDDEAGQVMKWPPVPQGVDLIVMRSRIIRIFDFIIYIYLIYLMYCTMFVHILMYPNNLATLATAF